MLDIILIVVGSGCFAIAIAYGLRLRPTLRRIPW